MSLNNPDSRRALRSVVQTVVALSILALVYWLVHLLRHDLPGLREIARYSLGIVALGTVFYGVENATRAFKLSVGVTGVTAESAGEAAQSVADAAQVQAEEVKRDGA